MTTSLNDVTAWIKDIFRRLRRLESGAFLESSSISHGRMRFIGGLLLIDSGGTLQVVGHLNGDGDFVWHGPWAFTGTGEITGDVDLTGNLDVLDDGRITAGDVRIEDGKIYVRDMIIDPDDNGGSVRFPGGAKVTANSGATGVKIESGSGWSAYVAANGIRLAGAVGQASITLLPDSLAIGADRVQIAADDLVLGAPTGSLADVSHVLARTSSGEARWIPKADLSA